MDKINNILIGFDENEYPGVKSFRSLGDCVYHRYDREYLEEHIHQFDVLIPHLFFQLDDQIISKAKRLKIVATPSTGTDHINLSLLKNNGIKVISLNDDRSFIEQITSTAEMTWLLILASYRKMRHLHDRVYLEKKWDNVDIRGNQLSGKTIGIIGYGRLGKLVSGYANAFNMRVLAYDTAPDAFSGASNATQVELKALFAESDIISLHAKLNNNSKQIIDYAAVSLMKRGVMIINTARGELIDPDAVLNGLNSGIIAAIGLDVCTNEYQLTELPKDPLLSASFTDRRIIVTPHAGGATHDAHAIVFNKIYRLVCNYLLRE
jgi:D-3-phosphoglycerate dehydrogenase / 2-oxoglutarate reductase